ncbi:hypothetical protein [Lactobacillus phage Maenad]|uniref:Uncharacterized protein n=1 Tax=Lactobacillus phage Maenad TaxID=2079431 RepID=A0A2P0ZKV3_9CAUD|nr:hypothetical protein HOS85_gp062 [Lactobacillus phage Maenad]AVH85636.1 hypothetical protein [Lactobacillus phage Maenad]
MKVYLTSYKASDGVRVAYACASDSWVNFYFRRFDKSDTEKDVLNYIMSFADKSDEKIFIISNNQKMIKIMRKMEDTDNVSFIGRYESEQSRDIFVKLQVALTKKEN